MLRFFKKYRFYLFIAAWLLLYPLFLELTGIGCPIRFLFDVQCPGCGMTRAVVSALRFDFASAFAYHPAWLVPPIAAVLYVIFAKNEKARSVTLLAAAVLLLAGHAFRSIF